LGVAFGEETLKRVLKAKLVEALREELTSGDGNVKSLLTQLRLSTMLRDSAGVELSGYIRNIDVPLSRMPLGELALIPAVYYTTRTPIYGYARISGGGFVYSPESISGGYWSGFTAGDYIEFEFYGTWFDVVFFEKAGGVNIYVDGVLRATVDVSKLKGPYRNVVWRGPRDLSDDYHTVRIEYVPGFPVRVVGVVVDPAKNVWRIIPFLYDLHFMINGLYGQGTAAAGIYVRSNTTSNPVYAEKWPAFRTTVSTTTALAAGGTWISASVDCIGFPPRVRRILVTLFSDQSGTLYIEFSPDNTNWDSVESFSYTGNTTPVIGPVEVKGRYARLRYVNGATAQTVFRLYAWFMGD
jgi:hypothetical protein